MTRQPRAAGGVDRHSAPAGTDLQQVIVRPHAQASRMPSRTCGAAPVRACPRARTPRRVGHGLVQEEREQLVGEVVVADDVRPRPDRPCSRRASRARLVQPAQPLQRLRNERGQSRRRTPPAARPGRWRGRPIAGHVGLAESDLAVAAQPPQERVAAGSPSPGASRPPALITRPSGSSTRSGSRATARRNTLRAMAARTRLGAAPGRRAGRAGAGRPPEWRWSSDALLPVVHRAWDAGRPRGAQRNAVQTDQCAIT